MPKNIKVKCKNIYKDKNKLQEGFLKKLKEMLQSKNNINIDNR